MENVNANIGKEKVAYNAEAYLENVEFFRPNNLVNEVVFMDGLGRSGKCLFAHLISTFERVEKQNNCELFEFIGILWRSGKLADDAATILLQLEGDMKLYNTYIGREVNFRFADDSGVFNNGNPLRYVKRLFANAREDAVEKILKEKPIMQAGMHDGLRNAQLYFNAFAKLKMIYVFRDPVQLVFEWKRGGFDHSIGQRLREFHPTVRCDDNVVPYSVVGWGQEYLKLGAYDRLIRLINNHFELNIDNFYRLSDEQKRRIAFVTFEEIVTKPWPLCEKLARFLGTKITFRTKKMLKKERCPRFQDPKVRKEQLLDIEKNASPQYVEVFHKLLERYESRFWENAVSLDS